MRRRALLSAWAAITLFLPAPAVGTPALLLVHLCKTHTFPAN